MKNKKLNLDYFMGCELPSNQKMYVRGGDTTAPEIDEEGNPLNPKTTSNNGDVKDPPPPPIVVTAFIE